MAVQKEKDAALDCIHVTVHTLVLISLNTQHNAIIARSAYRLLVYLFA